MFRAFTKLVRRPVDRKGRVGIATASPGAKPHRHAHRWFGGRGSSNGRAWPIRL